MSIFQKVADKALNFIVKSSSWQRLWEIGEENRLLQGNAVTSPYSQVSNVYKAVKAIADNVPQAEFGLFSQKTDERDYDSAKARDLTKLLENPNPIMSGSDFMQAVVGFYALYGECFIVKTMETQGQVVGSKLPTELWTFNPSKFKEIKEGKTIVGWKYGANTYRLDEVIHFRDFNPNNMLRGLNPCEPIRKILDIDYRSLVYSSEFFKNYAQLGLTLSTDKTLSPVQRERIKADLVAKHEGASKAFKTAIFEGGLKPFKNTSTHKEMDFINQKKYTREEILGIWRAPKALFNITDDLNYATFQGQMKVFWLYGIMPILKKIESAFNRGLITSYDKTLYGKFDLSQVPAFKEDLKEQVVIAKDLFGMGVPFNAINEKLGLGFEDIDGGEIGYLPFNITPTDTIGMEIPEEPKDEKKKDDEEKAINHALKKQYDKENLWKNYIKRHSPQEAKFAKTISRFFYEQRNRVLAVVNKSKSVTKDSIEIAVAELRGINWDEEAKALKKRVRPNLVECAYTGVAIGKDRIGVLVNQDILETRIIGLVAQREGSFDNIQRTVKDLVTAVNDKFANGGTIDELTTEIKKVYTATGNRAKTIARTETGRAIQKGSYDYYDAVRTEEGVGMTKTWITAGDENVRELHYMADGQTVDFDDPFLNGMMHPNDPDGGAENVINCRCDYVTEMKLEG